MKRLITIYLDSTMGLGEKKIRSMMWTFPFMQPPFIGHWIFFGLVLSVFREISQSFHNTLPRISKITDCKQILSSASVANDGSLDCLWRYRYYRNCPSYLKSKLPHPCLHAIRNS